MVGSSFIGTAGWSIPKQHSARFPAGGSHLARYAQRLHAVEINSSFRRPHRASTYGRWAGSVPNGFRFAVKMPKSITHDSKLVDTEDLLDRFLEEVSALGSALGPVLMQLPPSLRYAPRLAESFFDAATWRFSSVVCEPRHPSWFTDEADARLEQWGIARVAADPAIVPRAASPGGWLGISYRRLHGSPDIYRSAYSANDLSRLAVQISRESAGSRQCWCIFDNTTFGEATGNALDLKELD